MRAEEQSSPQARRDGGVNVDVRAPRTRPAGGGMVESGRIRWRYFQRYRWKYRQRNTVTQHMCRGRRPPARPSAAAADGRPGRSCWSCAGRSAGRRARASDPRPVKMGAGGLFFPSASLAASPPAAGEHVGTEGSLPLRNRPFFIFHPRNQARGRPCTTRRSRMRPSPQGQHRGRQALPAASAARRERRRLCTRRAPIRGSSALARRGWSCAADRARAGQVRASTSAPSRALDGMASSSSGWRRHRAGRRRLAVRRARAMM